MHHIATYTSTNQREKNDDCCLGYQLSTQHDECAILLLSDGMGGHDHGEVISRMAVNHLSALLNRGLLGSSLLPAVDEQDNLPAIIRQALQITNHKVLQLIRANEWEGGGATLALAVLNGEHLFWANLGDTRIYLFRTKEKKLVQLGCDHNVPGLLAREGSLPVEAAKFHARKNQLVYFLGRDIMPVETDLEFYGKVSVETGDIVLLLSDGMYQRLPESWLTEHLTALEPEQLETFLRRTAAHLGALGEDDNQSGVALAVGTPGRSSGALLERTAAFSTAKFKAPARDELFPGS